MLHAGIPLAVQRSETVPVWRRFSRNVAWPRVAFLERDAHRQGVSASSPSRRNRQLGLLGSILLLTVLVGACGEPGSKHAAVEHPPVSARVSSPRSTAPPPTSTTRASGEAVAVVRTYWATYLELARRPGPFDSIATQNALTRVATGAALEKLLTVLRTNAAAGYVVHGAIESNPRLVSQVGSNATVRDCYDDRSGLFQVTDGARIDQDDPRPHLATFGLVLQADGWKVSTIEQPEEPCANS